jgi:hypothetical protein
MKPILGSKSYISKNSNKVESTTTHNFPGFHHQVIVGEMINEVAFLCMSTTRDRKIQIVGKKIYLLGRSRSHRMTIWLLA